MYMYIYIYIYIYIYVRICIYLYIIRERARGREEDLDEARNGADDAARRVLAHDPVRRVPHLILQRDLYFVAE